MMIEKANEFLKSLDATQYSNECMKDYILTQAIALDTINHKLDMLLKEKQN